MYTLQGFTIATSEQARTMLLIAMLKGDQAASSEAYRVLRALEEAGK